MTDDELNEIEARANAATNGPWEPSVYYYPQYGGCFGVGPYHSDENRGQGHADAAFIAHARQDVPALVAKVRRLRSENRDLNLQVMRLVNGEAVEGDYVTIRDELTFAQLELDQLRALIGEAKAAR